MWNCRIVGGCSSAGATVSAVVDAVDAPSNCDAAVRASSAIASLFKDFGASLASPSASNGERRVQGPATELEDLPTFEVQVVFVVPMQRSSVQVMIAVQARSESAAMALACAKLGRALRAKIDGNDVQVEFVEVSVRELKQEAQPRLFAKKDPATLPPVMVPPDTRPGLICECGHVTTRHDELPDSDVGARGPCQACATSHNLNKKTPLCAGFRTRDADDYVKVLGAAKGLVIDVVSEAPPARPPRRSGKDAAAGKDPEDSPGAAA